MNYIKFTIVCFLSAVFATACAPVYKAQIDMTGSGGIVWPGLPETPRIKYLWSLHTVGASGGSDDRGYADILAGNTAGDIPDAQTWNTLQRPQAIYVDDRRYYIADPGAARVTVIDRKTMDVMQLTDAGGVGLEFPIGIVADSSGRIYVSDPEMKKVTVYSEDGKFLFNFEGEMERPTGLAINRRTGTIYITDTLAHVVYMYGPDGKRIRSIGKRGDGNAEFNYPSHVCTDSKGRLYVTDFLNFRIQVFSPEGDFLNKFGRVGDSFDAFDKPKGVAVDSEGHIYVVDAGKDMVKIFSAAGDLLLYFGKTGRQIGDFYLPTGIFIDGSNVIYIADTINMRIQAFQFLGGG